MVEGALLLALSGKSRRFVQCLVVGTDYRIQMQEGGWGQKPSVVVLPGAVRPGMGHCRSIIISQAAAKRGLLWRAVVGPIRNETQ